ERTLGVERLRQLLVPRAHQQHRQDREERAAEHHLTERHAAFAEKADAGREHRKQQRRSALEQECLEEVHRPRGLIWTPGAWVPRPGAATEYRSRSPRDRPR